MSFWFGHIIGSAINRRSYDVEKTNKDRRAREVERQREAWRRLERRQAKERQEQREKDRKIALSLKAELAQGITWERLQELRGQFLDDKE